MQIFWHIMIRIHRDSNQILTIWDSDDSCYQNYAILSPNPFTTYHVFSFRLLPTCAAVCRQYWNIRRRADIVALESTCRTQCRLLR